MLPTLHINKVVFLNGRDNRRYAWYLTIVNTDSYRKDFKPCCFWSHHECSGMGDIEAAKAFERQHFQEVEVLIMQKMKNEILVTSN